jgi:hypothetical protein
MTKENTEIKEDTNLSLDVGVPLQEFNRGAVVQWLSDVLVRAKQAFALVQGGFGDENLRVEGALQSLVGVVDQELLKAVDLEGFKPENVQHFSGEFEVSRKRKDGKEF